MNSVSRHFFLMVPARIFLLWLPVVIAGCSPVFFHPSKKPIDFTALPEISSEETYFTSTDGVTLHGLILRPADRTKGTVLYFHGNTGNLYTNVDAIQWLVKNGYIVFTFDYRGYGRSEGTPDIAGVNEDGISALDAVFRIEGVDRDRVAVLGQSLGGAIAIYAVANSPRKGEVKALIIDSAFAGYRRIVRDKLISGILTLPFAWPGSWTVEDRYSPERWIGSLAPVPVVVIHGTKDPVVPFSHGERLYRLAGQPKGFWKVEGGAHTNAMRLPDVRSRLLEFLGSVFHSSAKNPPTPH